MNALFRTNNLEIIARAAEALDVPLALLVGYVDEPEVGELPIIQCHQSRIDGIAEILPEDVPVGDSTEDVEARRVFQHWQFCNWMRY